MRLINFILSILAALFIAGAVILAAMLLVIFTWLLVWIA